MLALLIEALSESRDNGAHAAPKFRLYKFRPAPRRPRRFIKRMKAMRATRR